MEGTIYFNQFSIYFILHPGPAPIGKPASDTWCGPPIFRFSAPRDFLKNPQWFIMLLSPNNHPTSLSATALFLEFLQGLLWSLWYVKHDQLGSETQEDNLQIAHPNSHCSPSQAKWRPSHLFYLYTACPRCTARKPLYIGTQSASEPNPMDLDSTRLSYVQRNNVYTGICW